MHRSVVAFFTQLLSPLFMRILLSSVRSGSPAPLYQEWPPEVVWGSNFGLCWSFGFVQPGGVTLQADPGVRGFPSAICLWESFAGSVWYHWWQSRETNSSSCCYMCSSHWRRPWRSQDSLWMTVSFKHPDFNQILTLWGGWYKATMCLYVFIRISSCLSLHSKSEINDSHLLV